jgi:hypothetical protein
VVISVPAETSADHKPSGQDRLFRLLFPLVMLAAVTALSFANAWPDAVALDDKFFVDNERLPGLTEPAELFRGDVWRTTEAASGLYRPALLVSLSLDQRMFGAWLPGYHLSNIVLQLVVTLLLYGFLRHLLRAARGAAPRADLYALLAALVFAAHPVHTEVVNSAFNRPTCWCRWATSPDFGGCCDTSSPVPRAPGPGWASLTCLPCSAKRMPW